MKIRNAVFGGFLVLSLIAGISLAVPAHWVEPCNDGTLAQETPQATFSFNYDEINETVTITHSGGEKLQGGEPVTQKPLPILIVEITHKNGHERVLWTAYNGSGIATDDIVNGDSIVLANSGSSTSADATLSKSLSTGDTVRVIWIDSGHGDLLNRRCKKTFSQTTI